jgi:hypothetical protein
MIRSAPSCCAQHSRQTERAVIPPRRPGLIELTRAADLFDNAAILVPYRCGLGEPANAAVGLQVGPAHARGRNPEDGVHRLDDLRRVALLETHVAVKNSSFHTLSFSAFVLTVPCIGHRRQLRDRSRTLRWRCTAKE